MTAAQPNEQACKQQVHTTHVRAEMCARLRVQLKSAAVAAPSQHMRRKFAGAVAETQAKLDEAQRLVGVAQVEVSHPLSADDCL